MMLESVFPMVEFIPESMAHANALPDRALELENVPAGWPLPFSMQKIKRPITTGGRTADFIV
jgi:hypothetical protein